MTSLIMAPHLFAESHAWLAGSKHRPGGRATIEALHHSSPSTLDHPGLAWAFQGGLQEVSGIAAGLRNVNGRAAEPYLGNRGVMVRSLLRMGQERIDVDLLVCCPVGSCTPHQNMVQHL